MILKKLTGYRLQVTGLTLFLLLIALLILPTTNSQLLTVSAQSCPTQASNPRAGGLISAPNVSNKFSNSTGQCVIDPNAAFAPYKLPSYETLKATYFDQSKSTSKLDYTGNLGESQLSSYLNGSSPKNLIHISGLLGMNSNNISGSNTAVVFIDGDLYFSSPMTQFTYGNGNSGIVFVVKGNVNIDPSVQQIDAVIIAGGSIYTAGAGCATNSVVVTSSLTINGSLISLGSNPIKFCRALSDNSQAVEKINQQPKYLVLLRNIFADTLQKWSEIQ